MARFAVLLLALAAVAALPVRGTAGDSNDPPRTYNIVLSAAASPTDFARSRGIRPRHTISRVFPGFSADLTPVQAQRLAGDPAVRGIAPARAITADGVAPVLTGY